ncbi:MAG: tRNA pseudouridine(38-40) synthase TruA [Spirochaetales bacterium]|jgi:tRNA pseudouridine38-40 synthase|nr:tRNA pseudouridine(38-40) synthase TruA [Spirochaetales bacterium]
MGNRIFLVLAYDGTDYSGWQYQTNAPTLQGTVEKALEVLHRRPTSLVASGRTDAGVHARGQGAHFESPNGNIPPSRYAAALNSLLPRDIRALRSFVPPPDTHARFSARLRVYHYYLHTGPAPAPPWIARYSWTLRRRPDILRLNEMAGFLPGRRDFSAFAAPGDPSRSKVRRVRAAGFFPAAGGLVFRIAADGFLWHMVRNLVGAMVKLEKEGRGEAFPEILLSRNPSLGNYPAPPRGLFLEKVFYDDFVAC